MCARLGESTAVGSAVSLGLSAYLRATVRPPSGSGVASLRLRPHAARTHSSPTPAQQLHLSQISYMRTHTHSHPHKDTPTSMRVQPPSGFGF